MAVFQLGKVYVGNADALGKFVEAHFAVSHNAVKTENYGHGVTSQSLVGELLELCAVREDVAHEQQNEENDDETKIKQSSTSWKLILLSFFKYFPLCFI